MTVLRAELSTTPAPNDRRRKARRTLRLVTLAEQTTMPSEVLIVDLSTTGMMIGTAAAISIGDILHFELPEVGTIAARLIWQREEYFGCEFLSPVPQAAVSAALLQSPPLSAPYPIPAFAPTAEPSLRADPGLCDEPRESPRMAPRDGLAMAALTALLIVVVLFMLALLTLPFSDNQFGD